VQTPTHKVFGRLGVGKYTIHGVFGYQSRPEEFQAFLGVLLEQFSALLSANTLLRKLTYMRQRPRCGPLFN